MHVTRILHRGKGKTPYPYPLINLNIITLPWFSEFLLKTNTIFYLKAAVESFWEPGGICAAQEMILEVMPRIETTPRGGSALPTPRPPCKAGNRG